MYCSNKNIYIEIEMNTRILYVWWQPIVFITFSIFLFYILISFSIKWLIKTYLKATPTTSTITKSLIRPPPEPCNNSSCDYECKKCDKKYGICGRDGKCHCAERCFHCDRHCAKHINKTTGIKNFTEEYLKLIDNLINYLPLNFCIKYNLNIKCLINFCPFYK